MCIRDFRKGLEEQEMKRECTAQRGNMSQSTVTHCPARQHSAAHCNTLL